MGLNEEGSIPCIPGCCINGAPVEHVCGHHHRHHHTNHASQHTASTPTVQLSSSCCKLGWWCIHGRWPIIRARPIQVGIAGIHGSGTHGAPSAILLSWQRIQWVDLWHTMPARARGSLVAGRAGGGCAAGGTVGGGWRRCAWDAHWVGAQGACSLVCRRVGGACLWMG